VPEADTSCTEARQETSAVSPAEEYAEDRLFFKRATIVYTSIAAPYEQVYTFDLFINVNHLSLVIA